MKKEVFILLTKGNDGRFSISTFETLERAEDMLKKYVDAQVEIEGQDAKVDVDYHKWQRFDVSSDFVVRDENVLAYVTTTCLTDIRKITTERYIIKSVMD